MEPNLHIVPDFESLESTVAAGATTSSETFDVEHSALDLQSSLPALVLRVSERLAIGISLQLAVAGEGLSSAEYERLLRENPELATLQAVTQREFVEDCIRKLLQAKNPSANIRWLLERLYPEFFGNPQVGGSRKGNTGLR
jgi:GTP cyclohydrolase FolE2